LWIAAAALPGIAALRGASPGDALLYTGGIAVIAGPLVGVAVGGSGSPRAVTRLVGLAVVFTASSALLAAIWSADRAKVASLLASSHLTLLATSVALGAWGSLCGVLFRDQLDAAGIALTVAVGAALGILVGGASVGELPRWLVTIGLAANPIVAVASAAQIDVVRMDLIYQISPLAHVQMDYPTWYLAAAGYVGFASVCFAGVTVKIRARKRNQV
jgi:hypothetical protein